MTRTVKALLIGGTALLILAVLAIFLVVRYVSANKDRLMARADEVRSAGVSFGKSRGESECVAEALGRYRGDRSLMGAVRARVWLSGCLESSSPEPSFCANVPRDDEITRTVAWRIAQCAQRGMEGDSRCPNILAEVQTYCEGDRRARKVSPPRGDGAG
ncbi:MAG TPA: hypothetical protein VNA04_04135 [Thermoanaerobaculia bacterium]|nr:hypothetical protein [Thermoanaerobaculia bacterium]